MTARASTNGKRCAENDGCICHRSSPVQWRAVSLADWIVESELVEADAPAVFRDAPAWSFLRGDAEVLPPGARSKPTQHRLSNASSSICVAVTTVTSSHARGIAVMQLLSQPCLKPFNYA